MFGRYQHDRTTTTTTKPLAASLETRQDRRETRPRNWRAAENAAEMLTDGGANERRARLLLPLRAAARCPAGLSRLASLTCLMYRCCLCDDVRARRNGPPKAAGRFVYPYCCLGRNDSHTSCMRTGAGRRADACNDVYRGNISTNLENTRLQSY